LKPGHTSAPEISRKKTKLEFCFETFHKTVFIYSTTKTLAFRCFLFSEALCLLLTRVQKQPQKPQKQKVPFDFMSYTKEARNGSNGFVPKFGQLD
jgi:hypothetical protein